jgi:hypothetical protein
VGGTRGANGGEVERAKFIDRKARGKEGTRKTKI